MKVSIDVSGALARRNKREGDDMSLNQLRKEIGISRQTLSNWEEGNSLKTLHDLLKLADFLGEDLSKLIKTSKR